LPKISTSRDVGHAKVNSTCAREGPHGFWSLRLTPADGGKAVRRKSLPPYTSTNEVETNPPYCPFHVDHRVSIFAYEETSFNSQVALANANDGSEDMFAFRTRGHGYAEVEDPWLFGEPLPASIKLNEHSEDELPPVVPGHEPDADATSNEDIAGMVESKMTLQTAGPGEGEQQINVNSRPSKRGRGGRRRDVETVGHDGMDDDGSLM
jgi:hypothetical protein